MILIDLKASLHCIEHGCGATEPVTLALNAVGTLALNVDGPAKDWQLIVERNNPAAPLLCRCPEHKSKLTTPPAAAKNILRSVNGH